MQRREFIKIISGSALAWPRAARAQQRSVRIGILLLGRAVPPKQLAITSELARLGYDEGRKVSYEIRGADGDFDRLPMLTRELVATKPDVLVGASEVAADALAKATHDIPIVITVMADPIASGLTSSMSRPTRNVSGFTISSLTLSAKRLELLHELIPDLRRVAYLTTPVGPVYNAFEQHVREAANALGLAIFSVPIINEKTVTDGFAIVEREKAQAILVETTPSNVRLSIRIIDECSFRALPAIHPWYFEVRAGALMSYGPTMLENYVGAARYVDRLLKGAKISDLPIQEPTEIKLAINLGTARAIKLIIPPTLLARADEVIE
ncbi:MAG TPA: ABC transporter substrate-binding protein [Gemmataceae bacterium]|jgi:putative ABC transport system substrate-binding protein|nr:ABC transporter substrate-binding protein [Gemmataceae bacterium]